MDTNTHIRVRFAPSPTGHLHIGGLRTTIFNWLFAKHNGGAFLLRIEDTDLERSKPEYTESILHSLKWMGIEPDEAIMIQSQRVPEHRRIAEQLIAQGKAYYCLCSQEEVVERHKKRMGFDDLFIKYDGACKQKKLSQADINGKPHVIRFALPFAKGEIAWDDLIRGHVAFDADQLDDFIIIRSDGMSMYNFAVVIDDAAMKISHVIRGEDHVSNTPKQILLYQACDYTVPRFAHLSMILGPSGDRLSKRDGAVSVLEYKNLGYLPDALFNYLVRLGWAHGDQEVFTREELVDLFSLEEVNKKAAIFDQQKLNWLNGVYIRQLSDQALLERIISDVRPALRSELAPWDDAKIFQLIALYKERVKTLQELAQELILVHGPHVEYAQEDVVHWITPESTQHLKEISATLQAMPEIAIDPASVALKELAKKLNVKFVNLAQPIRIALVGKSASPGVFELVVFLGKEESLKRIQHLLMHLEAQ